MYCSYAHMFIITSLKSGLTSVLHLEFPRCSEAVCTEPASQPASRISWRSNYCTTHSPLRVDNSKFNRCLVGWIGHVILRLGPGTVHRVCRLLHPGCFASMQAQENVLKYSEACYSYWGRVLWELSRWKKILPQELKMRCEQSITTLRN